MPYYLHDVRSIEEAVLWHDGEAEKAKDQFMNLSSAERGKLIRFLNSL
ncbi:MAG: di-heme oxidoredictase family protein [Parafilimonas sp.]